MDFGIQQFGILIWIVWLNICVNLSQFLKPSVSFFIWIEEVNYLMYKALLGTK